MPRIVQCGFRSSVGITCLCKSIFQVGLRTIRSITPWPEADVCLGSVAGQWSSVAELEQFCLEEWAKIYAPRCEKLIARCRKGLMSVVVAENGPTNFSV